MKKLVGFEDDLLSMQVAQWVARRNVGMSAEETDAFFEFMAPHSEGLESYQKYQRLYGVLDFNLTKSMLLRVNAETGDMLRAPPLNALPMGRFATSRTSVI